MLFFQVAGLSQMPSCVCGICKIFVHHSWFSILPLFRVPEVYWYTCSTRSYVMEKRRRVYEFLSKSVLSTRDGYKMWLHSFTLPISSANKKLLTNAGGPLAQTGDLIHCLMFLLYFIKKKFTSNFSSLYRNIFTSLHRFIFSSQKSTLKEKSVKEREREFNAMFHRYTVNQY